MIQVDAVTSDRPMRILHVIDSGGLYGAERVILTLGSECRKLGHEICVGTIVAPEDNGDPLGEAAVREGLKHVQFRMRDGLNVRGLREIFAFAREQSIDIIHSHGYKANILLALAPRRMRPCAMVCTLHGWTSKSSFQKLAVYENLEKVLVRRFDYVVAVSDSIQQKIQPLVRKGQVLKIANGMPVSLSSPSERSRVWQESKGTEGDPISLLAIGRLSYEKGFDILIAAARLLREQGVHVSVRIAGDGPRKNELSGLIEAAELKGQVLLTGYVTDPRPLYLAADIFVLSSRTEGLPLVLLEAMSLGTPVIATPVGDVPQVLGEEECGHLLTSTDAPTLAKAVCEFIEAGAAARERVVRNAKRRIEQEYSATAMAEKYLHIYSTLNLK